jgi:Dyp-type peroxidase family
MPIDLDHFPVDPVDGGLTNFLSDLQGNILKGHGRPFTFNIFVKFKPNQSNALRDWIAAFSNTFVTSASTQLSDTQRFHDEKIPGRLFVSLFLTAHGYERLNIPVAKRPNDPQFKLGMRKAGTGPNGLQDPAPATWDAGYDNEIDAMILVADSDVHHARSVARGIVRSLEANNKQKAAVMRVERGVALRNEKGEGIEHNNYVDGISQPAFFDDERQLPHDKWDPEATPRLMLVKDVNGKFANDSFGSYFVYRKLEQDVRGFKTREKDVAKSVFNLPADESTWTDAQKDQAELIGAWAVGRFEDGTPVVMHDEPQRAAAGSENNPQENNFNYADAGSESKCPFFAHIRKSAPRTDAAGPGFNKTRRLVRRGIPFEDKPRIRNAKGGLSDRHADQPTGGVGLLFMCYVADIADQFEFVQKQWINDTSFSQGGTGKDPLIGQPTGGQAYQWPTAWGDAHRKAAAFGDFITMKGGAYFFAPCLSTLRSLKTTAAMPKVDEVLQLFIPNPDDIGAGVLNKPAH